MKTFAGNGAKKLTESAWGIWVVAPLLGIMFGLVILQAFRWYDSRPDYSKYVGKNEFSSVHEYLEATHLPLEQLTPRTKNGKIDYSFVTVNQETLNTMNRLLNGSDLARATAISEAQDITDPVAIQAIASEFESCKKLTDSDARGLAYSLRRWKMLPVGQGIINLFAVSKNPVLQKAASLALAKPETTNNSSHVKWQ